MLAALLFAASAVATSLNLRNLQDSRDTVSRTNAILQDAAELQTAVREAETGQRGYLLTGDGRYLEPYRRALTTIPAELRDLDRRVQVPAQVERVGRLRPLIDAKLSELAQTIALHQRGEQQALTLVRTGLGQRLMEHIDAEIAVFNTAERGLLAERVAEEQRLAADTAMAAALTGLFGLGLGAAGLWMFYRQRSAEALARLNTDLERQVAEQTASLTEVNRQLDAFAYTISHDLRAPLRAMHGYSDALVEDYADVLPPEGRKFADAIANAARRMDALINDILAYTRLSRERLTLRPVGLSQIVGRLRDQMLAERPDAEIEVEAELPRVLAHPAALEQAVGNLLSNAVKFTAPGVRARVRIRAERNDGRVRFWVEDNGIGLAPEHQARVFEPFERLHGVETYPGAGIGLAIVKRTAERMNGATGVVSELGKGSRFWLELEAAEAAQ